MKSRMVRALVATCLASVMLGCLAVTVSAAEPDYSKEIEEMTKRLDGMTVTPSGGSVKQTKPAAPAEPSKLLTDDELEAYAYKVFELVNKEREKAGVSPLDYREDIAEAAKLRANEIVGNYTHTRPDGTKFSTVFDEIGIQKKSSGENIYTSPITPEAAVKGWMASESHRNNILKEKYTATGIGVYQDKAGGLHWVELFIQEK